MQRQRVDILNINTSEHGNIMGKLLLASPARIRRKQIVRSLSLKGFLSPKGSLRYLEPYFGGYKEYVTIIKVSIKKESSPSSFYHLSLVLETGHSS